MKTIKVTKAEILKHYKPAEPDTHKGTQGHALLIGGSYGKMGSISLTTKAALKSGCGLATAFIPKCGYGIVQIGVPEAMIFTDTHKNHISRIHYDITPQAIGIGPGIGKEKETQKALQRFLKANETPLVIDADALNILSLNQSWYSLLLPKTILTPHPKELERLVGPWYSQAEKMQKATDFSKQYNIIIVMKGAPTHIVNGDTVYENTTGNAALATAGSGDVLTGIITGLLAQSYEPIDAAILGVYLHGLTADIALPETGSESFIASDILAYLGKAFLSLQK
jgi:ADP-dependent NAD(P)H-hydrate dehydratase